MTNKHIGLGILVAILWAGNVLASKVASGYIPPFTLSAFRYALAAMCLLPFINKVSTPLKTIFWIAQVWGSLYMSLFFMGLFLGLDSNVTCILLQVSVPVTAIIDSIFLRQMVSGRKMFGIFLAILGVYILKDSPNILSNPTAFLIVLFAGMSWAFASFLIKITNEKNQIAMVAWMCLMTTPFFMVMIYLSQYITFLPNEILFLKENFVLNYSSIGSFLYILFVATMFVHSSWLYLLKHNSNTEVISFLLLVPVFGVLLSSILLGELLTKEIIFSGLAVILGMILILRDEKAKRKKMLK